MSKALVALILSVLAVPVPGIRIEQGPSRVQFSVSNSAWNDQRPTGRTKRAVAVGDYRKLSSTVNVSMRGTSLAPQARGAVRLRPRRDHLVIESEFNNMRPAAAFGPEYLTYVVWAIFGDGRAMNLGELALNGAAAKFSATTDSAAFGLIVTAEPYFAVAGPSELVVMENVFQRGAAQSFEAKYRTLPRGAYTKNISSSEVKPIVMDGRTPLDLYEARNAVWIAIWAGADESPSGFFDKAERALQSAEAFHASGAERAVVQRAAREAVQSAENARALAAKGDAAAGSCWSNPNENRQRAYDCGDGNA